MVLVSATCLGSQWGPVSSESILKVLRANIGETHPTAWAEMVEFCQFVGFKPTGAQHATVFYHIKYDMPSFCKSVAAIHREDNYPISCSDNNYKWGDVMKSKNWQRWKIERETPTIFGIPLEIG
jgi:hypothetical protein